MTSSARNWTPFEADLKTAQDNIDALRADVLDAKALANKAQATADNSYGVGSNRKFQISGYIQARYQSAAAPDRAHWPASRRASPAAPVPTTAITSPAAARTALMSAAPA